MNDNNNWGFFEMLQLISIAMQIQDQKNRRTLDRMDQKLDEIKRLVEQLSQ